MSSNIEGKVVVITGASSGLGEATARLRFRPNHSRAVAFAVSQPEDVDVNEILFRPTRQDLWDEGEQHASGHSGFGVNGRQAGKDLRASRP